MDALIAKLESAAVGSRDLDGEIQIAVHGKWPQRLEMPYHQQPYFVDEPGLTPAFTISIDAALTLVPEGFRVQLDVWLNKTLKHIAHCNLEADADTLEVDECEPIEIEVNNRPSPAVALCIAALKARALK